MIPPSYNPPHYGFQLGQRVSDEMPPCLAPPLTPALQTHILAWAP